MKTIQRISSLIVAGSLIFSSVGQAIACTSITVTDLNGNAYHGRTLEFSFAFPTRLTYFPAGTKIESVTPSGEQGVTFNTKFAILGQSSAVVPGAKQPLIVDGSNDQGLSFSANELNGLRTPPVGKDASKILSANDFGGWILGNFKTVAEVKAAMLSDNTEFGCQLFQRLAEHWCRSITQFLIEAVTAWSFNSLMVKRTSMTTPSMC